MELQIRGNGIAVDDDLRAFAEQRTAKLDHLVDARRVVDAKLELRHRHHRSGPDTVSAQLTIQTGRRLLRAEEDDPEARVAVDRAVDKLVGQLRRFHDKRSGRTGSRADADLDAVAADAIPAAAGLDGDDPGGADGVDRLGLVRTKRFSLKPMDVEEAIEQMELLGHDFYLFHNADEHHLGVVYRRRDGTYGLLVPDRG